MGTDINLYGKWRNYGIVMHCIIVYFIIPPLSHLTILRQENAQIISGSGGYMLFSVWEVRTAKNCGTHVMALLVFH